MLGQKSNGRIGCTEEGDLVGREGKEEGVDRLYVVFDKEGYVV